MPVGSIRARPAARAWACRFGFAPLPCGMASVFRTCVAIGRVRPRSSAVRCRIATFSGHSSFGTAACRSMTGPDNHAACLSRVISFKSTLKEIIQKEKTRAVARVSIWCSVELVNHSTAISERYHKTQDCAPKSSPFTPVQQSRSSRNSNTLPGDERHVHPARSTLIAQRGLAPRFLLRPVRLPWFQIVRRFIGVDRIAPNSPQDEQVHRKREMSMINKKFSSNTLKSC